VRFSAPVRTGPVAHPASCTTVTGSFPEGKKRPGREADPSPPSSAVVKKEQSYTSTPPMGRTACTEPQCLYKGALYLTLPFYLRLYEDASLLVLSSPLVTDIIGRHVISAFGASLNKSLTGRVDTL